MGRYKKQDNPQHIDKDKLAKAMGYKSDAERTRMQAERDLAELRTLYPDQSKLAEASKILKTAKKIYEDLDIDHEGLTYCILNDIPLEGLKSDNPLKCQLTKIQMAILAPLFLQYFSADGKVSIAILVDFFACRQPMRIINNSLFFYFMSRLQQEGIIAHTWREYLLLLNKDGKKITSEQIRKSISKTRNVNPTSKPHGANIVEDYLSLL